MVKRSRREAARAVRAGLEIEEGEGEGEEEEEDEDPQERARVDLRLRPRVLERLRQDMDKREDATRRGDLPHLVAARLVGLTWNADYQDPRKCAELRYQRLAILADADDYGKQITSLILSSLYAYFRSVLTRCTEPPDPQACPLSAAAGPPEAEKETRPFLYLLQTPLYSLKLLPQHDIWRDNGRRVLNFATTEEYNAWVQANPQLSAEYQHRFYKGLGSIRDPADVFGDMDRLALPVVWTPLSERAIETVLLTGRKDASEARRDIIMGRGSLVQQVQRETRRLQERFPGRPFVSVAHFLCVDLAAASRRLVQASLPHVCDGLKQASRLVVQTALARPPQAVCFSFSCCARGETGTKERKNHTGVQGPGDGRRRHARGGLRPRGDLAARRGQGHGLRPAPQHAPAGGAGLL